MYTLGVHDTNARGRSVNLQRTLRQNLHPCQTAGPAMIGVNQHTGADERPEIRMLTRLVASEVRGQVVDVDENARLIL